MVMKQMTVSGEPAGRNLQTRGMSAHSTQESTSGLFKQTLLLLAPVLQHCSLTAHPDHHWPGQAECQLDSSWTILFRTAAD
jgi:hypothetical protein